MADDITTNEMNFGNDCAKDGQPELLLDDCYENENLRNKFQHSVRVGETISCGANVDLEGGRELLFEQNVRVISEQTQAMKNENVIFGQHQDLIASENWCQTTLLNELSSREVTRIRDWNTGPNLK